MPEDKTDLRDESLANTNPSDWRSIGPGPLAILQADPTPASYLGLLERNDHQEKPPWL